MGRMVVGFLLLVGLVPCLGCSLGPRNFRKISHPAPLVRARAISLGDDQPDAQVIPALVTRLDDNDPVVRLAAHEELRKRTGKDFGYLPWGGSEERAGAIQRWRAWLTGGPARSAAAPRRPSKNPPSPSPQGSG